MSKKIHVRPGKSQSKVGFVAGIIFCLIGVFVAIPIFGPFGILWTAMAALITFANYRNGFTDKAIDSHVIEVEEDGRDVTVTSHTGFGAYSYETKESATEKEDVTVRLRKLQSLYDQALITREEYEQKRREILDEL